MKGKENSNYKHGYATGKVSSVYHRWYGMIQRCHNPKHYSYKYYGGRGIKVCKEWRDSIKNFIDDMGEPPKGKTLDRIDNNGNYCKENCRWVTPKEQSENKRRYKNSKLIKHNGEEKTIKEWADELGIKYITLYARVNQYNMSVEKALTKKICPLK